MPGGGPRLPPRRRPRARGSCKGCLRPGWAAAASSSPEPRAAMEPKAAAAAAAAASSSFKEELLCPICYDPFREAVTLGCGHNFCKACVRLSWQHQDRPSCPVCKEEASLDDLCLNRTLNNLVEVLRREESRREGQRPALCPLHGQKAKLFCQEDKELACFACQCSEQHQGHKLLPVGETAKDYRAKWRNMENSLRDKVKDFGMVQRSYESISKHNQEEVARLEDQIRKEFEKLHEFLHQEEKAVLSDLHKEARNKQDLIKEEVRKLTEDSSALLHEVNQLQADLKEDDDISFLMKHKNRKRRIGCTAEEPEAIPPGILVDVPKFLGSLQYKVWRKMLDIITVVPFSFDPRSAAGWLSVSSNLTSVTNGSYKLLVDNPERFSSAPCILGSRGFLHGSHSWEVDLGGLVNWRVGVASKRSGRRWNFHHDARSGFWYIYRLPGADSETCRVSNSARTETPLRDLRRIRVELDFDEGELSFYDADQKSHIYTFHEQFSAEVFPYFYVGSLTPDSPAGSLSIRPLRVLIGEALPL